MKTSTLTRFAMLVAGFALLASIPGAAQTQEAPFMVEAPFKAGPFGRPIEVTDEGGNWSIPISVYSDSAVEVFINDVTSDGWVSWRAQHFRETGGYVVMLYFYYKANHHTRWVCVSVDSRKHTAIDQTALLGPITVPPMTIPVSIADRISAIVSEAVNDYTGPTAQEATKKNTEIQMKIAAQLMTPRDSLEGRLTAVQPHQIPPPPPGWKLGKIQRFTHEPHVETPPQPSTGKKLGRIFAAQAGIALPPSSNPAPRVYIISTIEVPTADGVQTWVYSGPSVPDVGHNFYYREDGNKRIVQSEHPPLNTYDFELKGSN